MEKDQDQEQPKPSQKVRITKISHDNGKTWDDVPELENVKVVEN